MAAMKDFNIGGFVLDGKIKTVGQEMSDRLRVKTPSVNQLLGKLSGGNQQKVVIARWLMRDCDILIFDEPTRGIDVGAKDEIYALLRRSSPTRARPSSSSRPSCRRCCAWRTASPSWPTDTSPASSTTRTPPRKTSWSSPPLARLS